MSSPVVDSAPVNKENVDPQTAQPAVDPASASPAPVTGKRTASAVSTTSASSTTEPAQKKRQKSATAPRTLTKEELAGYIARGEFWQKEAEGDGEDDHGSYRTEDGGIWDDCDDVRRKITAFLRSGRMNQTAWCKLVDVNNGPFQRFMKQSVHQQTTHADHNVSHYQSGPVSRSSPLLVCANRVRGRAVVVATACIPLALTSSRVSACWSTNPSRPSGRRRRSSSAPWAVPPHDSRAAGGSCQRRHRSPDTSSESLLATEALVPM